MIYRREIKYVVAVMEFKRIKKELDALLFPDENEKSEAGYMVRSLYFDSIDNRDLTDSLDGLLVKGKIRLRIYSHDTPTAKLEYKSKNGAEGVKEVITITRKQAEQMIQADYAFLADIDHPVAEKIYLRMCDGAYIPSTIVQYTRKAYLYPPSDVRITFDSDIRTSCVASAFFDEYPALYPMVEPDYGVFEVKYNDFFPTIFKNIVSRLDRIPVANSKYAQSRLFY